MTCRDHVRRSFGLTATTTDGTTASVNAGAATWFGDPFALPRPAAPVVPVILRDDPEPVLLDTRRVSSDNERRVAGPGDGTESRRSVRRTLTLGLMALVVAGVAALAVTSSSAVRRQLLLSFTRRPDNFAELYFPSPSTVPTSFVPGRPLPITFGLTNDSDVTRTYTYAATARSGQGASTLEGSGKLRVDAGAAVVVPLRLELPAGTESVSITLSGQPVVVRLLLHQGVAHGP